MSKKRTKQRKRTNYEYINHPKHYGGADDPYETIKVIYAKRGLNGVLALADKHLGRMGAKPGESELQDLKKARFYLDWLIERIDTDKTKGVNP